RGVRPMASGSKQVSSSTASQRQNQGQSETHRPSPREELKRDHRAISMAVTRTSERADALRGPCIFRAKCIDWRHSISRCALLNAPAGSFSSRDIVKIELNRVMVM